MNRRGYFMRRCIGIARKSFSLRRWHSGCASHHCGWWVRNRREGGGEKEKWKREVRCGRGTKDHFSSEKFCRCVVCNQEGGGGHGVFPPSHNFPSPEILKLSMVINVLSQVLNNNLVPDCVRSNLRGSKFKIFLGGTCHHTPLVGTHLHVRSPPPPKSKFCMKPWQWYQNVYVH